MAIENCGIELQEILNLECDGQFPLRSQLHKLGESLNDLRAGLIFSDLTNQFTNNSEAQLLFFQAITQIELATLSIKQCWHKI